MSAKNGNKTIAVNSVILYIRLFLNTITSLLATRFALQALGVVDFGLFSVLGSVISFIAVFNTIMVSTSNRFIAVAIGKGNEIEVNEQFNVNLIIHILIAVFTAIIAIPLGEWYIDHFLNFDGDLNLAKFVYRITVIGSIVSFLSVPYNGLLMAKEKFIVFCTTDVIVHLFKMAIPFVLIYYCSEKLFWYAAGISFTTAAPALVYYLYCKKHYPDIVRFRLVRNRNKFKEVLGFSAWVSYGAIANIGKTQGAAVIVNKFFDTVMNTALGISNSVQGLLTLFAQNIAQPIAPQITKSYASGNMERCKNLMVASAKYSYMVMFLIAVPFLVDAEFILKIWLHEVPPFAVLFCQLLTIDTLVISFNSGISTLVFASGNIKSYQLSINTLKMLSIVAGYFVLRAGFPAYSLIIVYIFFSVLAFVAGQIVISKTLHFGNKLLFVKAYIPCGLVTIFFVPYAILHPISNAFVSILVGVLYVLILELLICVNCDERDLFKQLIK